MRKALNFILLKLYEWLKFILEQQTLRLNTCYQVSHLMFLERSKSLNS